MKGAWWVDKDELDDEQALVITRPADESFTVVGPPGSGKTNLLLLRANYLYASGHKNILILVFTRSLKEFIGFGSHTYDFPLDRIKTFRSWASSFLFEHGVRVQLPEDFSEARAQLVVALRNLLDKEKIEGIYDAILVDEAQDYNVEELEIVRRLARRLVLAGDTEQKIYEASTHLAEPEKFTGKSYKLKHHYRNGGKICSLADALGNKFHSHVNMLDGCNYDEVSKPSSVEVLKFENNEAQLKTLIEKLILQSKAYPEELLGVVSPRTEDVLPIAKYIEEAGFTSQVAVHGSGRNDGFGETTVICVTTFHGAKGLEFRALNIVFADKLRSMPHLRNLAYTAVTRCKTSLVVYYTGGLPAFFDSALISTGPKPELATLDQAFGKKK